MTAASGSCQRQLTAQLRPMCPHFDLPFVFVFNCYKFIGSCEVVIREDDLKSNMYIWRGFIRSPNELVCCNS